jgi:hypothetical protein
VVKKITVFLSGMVWPSHNPPMNRWEIPRKDEWHSYSRMVKKLMRHALPFHYSILLLSKAVSG